MVGGRGPGPLKVMSHGVSGLIPIDPNHLHARRCHFVRAIQAIESAGVKNNKRSAEKSSASSGRASSSRKRSAAKSSAVYEEAASHRSEHRPFETESDTVWGVSAQLPSSFSQIEMGTSAHAAATHFAHALSSGAGTRSRGWNAGDVDRRASAMAPGLEVDLWNILNFNVSRYNSDFTEIGIIGRGGFGKVYKVSSRSTSLQLDWPALIVPLLSCS